jgi:hypothetical protein
MFKRVGGDYLFISRSASATANALPLKNSVEALAASPNATTTFLICRIRRSSCSFETNDYPPPKTSLSGALLAD